MAWFERANEYYREFNVDDAIGQGDIVIAPTTLVLSGTSESDLTGPTDLGQTRRSTLWHGTTDALPAAPALSAETRWGLAMVIPHACAMEKEWNERRTELARQGLTEEQAKAQANAETDLDQYVTLAPLLLYASVPEWKHRGIRTGQRLGFFPVCENTDVPAGFVDFNRFATVHYTLIIRALRQRVLSDLALAHLHHALAMHFAYRGLSRLDALEAAIGQRIIGLSPSTRAKGKLIVNIALENGQSLTLEGQDAPLPQEAARPARG